MPTRYEWIDASDTSSTSVQAALKLPRFVFVQPIEHAHGAPAARILVLEVERRADRSEVAAYSSNVMVD